MKTKEFLELNKPHLLTKKRLLEAKKITEKIHILEERLKLIYGSIFVSQKEERRNEN